MPFSAVLVWRTIQAILYYQFLCKFAVRRFRAFGVNLYPKEEKRFTAQISGSGAIPSYCTIFPVFHCLYCTTNRCSPSRTRALFSGQDSGIVQAAEVPLFSEKYNATDTADILGKEEPPTPLRLRHRFQHLPACQLLPGCESFNKLLLPPGTHTPPAGQHTHNTGRKRFP